MDGALLNTIALGHVEIARLLLHYGANLIFQAS